MKEFGEYKQMKRKLLVTLVALMMCVNINAQKFEVIREYPFDDFLQYYEDWPDDIGYSSPGLVKIISFKNRLLIMNDANTQCFYGDKEYEIIPEDIHYEFKVINGVLFLTFKDSIRVYFDSLDISKPNYILPIDKKEFPTFILTANFMTEGMVFAQTNEDKLISWKLLGNGKSEYYNAKQTQEMLDSGLAEKIGLSTNKTGTNFFFGEFNATSGSGPNYINIMNDLTIKTEKYSSFDGLSSFHDIGTDKNGLSYFYRFKYNGKKYALEDPDNPIEVLIAVLDPWTKEVNIIELPAGDWDPSRNAGGLIARCSQCIDEYGNVYFTDCNKEKGVYQIKKLTNTWSEELGYNKRIIGRVNANQIPLYKSKKTSSETNGYNYEHEFLWVLEKGKTWCKVRKVDGREGFIETKYIDFN